MTDFETMCSFENLYDAYKKARSGKRDKAACAEFELRTLDNIAKLREELVNKTYKMQKYNTFLVHEPKERVVMASSFRDRIVQHSLCDNVFQKRILPHFIYDNYASQKGKGTHFGLRRLHKFMHQYYCNHGSEGWILKGDISKYFYSIDHDILKRQIQKLIQDKDILNLCNLIIDSTEGKGLPIGNQTSQAFALLYLNDLDHLIKDKMGIKYYGRYMDDFYIIMPEKEKLKKMLEIVKQEVEKLGLSLNPKTQIFPLKNGIDFLGFHSYLTESGKIVKKIRKNSKNNAKRRLRKLLLMRKNGKISKEKVLQSYDCWMNHAKHGNTYHLRKNIEEEFGAKVGAKKGSVSK